MRRFILLSSVWLLLLVAVLAVARQQEPLPQWIYFERDNQLHWMTWNGTGVTPLSLRDTRNMSVSPDGQWIVWVDNLYYSLYLSNVTLTQTMLLSTDFTSVVWSPDSKKIATITKNRLIIFDLFSKKWYPLAIPTTDIWDFRWSSNGDWLLFAGWLDGNSGLFRVRPDSSGFQSYNVREFNIFSWEIGLAWSPDDEHIAFSIKKPEEGEVADIYVMQADGTNIRNLTNTTNVDESVVQWSPDGKWIYFTTASHELFRIQTSGKKELLGMDAYIYPLPRINTFHDWILYYDFTGNTTSSINRYNVETDETVQLTDGRHRDVGGSVVVPTDLPWHPETLAIGAALTLAAAAITMLRRRRLA